jgi:hypothetical protein
MKLNKNSISCRLYKYFWDEVNYELPKNLCPYFWKLVIAYIFIVPLALLALPYLLYKLIFDRDHDYVNMFVKAVAGLLIYALIVALLLVVVAHIIAFTKGGAVWVIVIITWIAPTVLFIRWCVLGIYYKIQEKKGEKEYTEPQPNILVEFIKAKYHKYCPKIDWN